MATSGRGWVSPLSGLRLRKGGRLVRCLTLVQKASKLTDNVGFGSTQPVAAGAGAVHVILSKGNKCVQ